MQKPKGIFLAVIFAAMSVCQPAATTAAAGDILVFAASSLKAPLDRIVAAYDGPVRVSYASSSVLARQIGAGAPAHVFLSANRDWADYVAGTPPQAFAGNEIAVVVAGGDSDAPVMDRFKQAGRIAIALPGAVPLGIYAKQALSAQGLWDDTRARVVGVDSAAKAVQLFRTGMVPAAVLYTSDIAQYGFAPFHIFDSASHDPIEYVATDLGGGAGFVGFLFSPSAQHILQDAGFKTVEQEK